MGLKVVIGAMFVMILSCVVLGELNGVYNMALILGGGLCTMFGIAIAGERLDFDA